MHKGHKAKDDSTLHADLYRKGPERGVPWPPGGRIEHPPAQGDVSIQAQLEANDIPEYANEPGPGHYFGPENNGFSSMGNQKFAKCASAPEIEFPRTGWDEWRKVIISKGHEGAYMLRDSPGAVYKVPPAPADMQLRIDPYGKPVPSGAKIGSSQRPDLSVSLGMNPAGSPGPKYNVRDSKKEDIKITREQMNSKTDRFENRTYKGSTGMYNRKDVALNTGTGRSFGIGRSAYDKVIRPGWEKEGQCRVSAKLLHPQGEEILKNIEKDGSRAHSIGKAARFPKDREAAGVPGPGMYRRDERDVSKCNSVCSDTANPGGAAFGRRQPRKPRFRQVLAMNCAKHGGWGYF